MSIRLVILHDLGTKADTELHEPLVKLLLDTVNRNFQPLYDTVRLRPDASRSMVVQFIVEEWWKIIQIHAVGTVFETAVKGAPSFVEATMKDDDVFLLQITGPLDSVLRGISITGDGGIKLPFIISNWRMDRYVVLLQETMDDLLNAFQRSAAA